MINSSAAKAMALRNECDVSMMDAARALRICNGDEQQAKKFLKQRQPTVHSLQEDVILLERKVKYLDEKVRELINRGSPL